MNELFTSKELITILDIMIRFCNRKYNSQFVTGALVTCLDDAALTSFRTAASAEGPRNSALTTICSYDPL